MRTLKLLIALTVVAACGSSDDDNSALDTLAPRPTAEVQDPPPATSTSTSGAAAGGPASSAPTSTTAPLGAPYPGIPGRRGTTPSTGATGATQTGSTTETTGATGTIGAAQTTTTTRASATTQPSGQTATTAPTPTTTTPPKKAQTISFAQPSGPWAYGEPKSVVATASSGLPVSYDTSGSCEVDNALLGIIRASDVGECSITVSQQGDGAWKPATPVTRSITISKATPVISGFSDGSYEHTRSPFTITLTATATGGAVVEYRTLLDDRGEAFCTLVGGQLQVPSTDILPRTCIVEAFVRASRLFEASSATARFAITQTVVRFTGHSVVEVTDTSVTLSVTLNRIWNISVYADCGSPPELLEGQAQYTFSFALAAPITAEAPCTIDVSTFSFDGSHTSDRLAIRLP